MTHEPVRGEAPGVGFGGLLGGVVRRSAAGLGADVRRRLVPQTQLVLERRRLDALPLQSVEDVLSEVLEDG